MQLNQPIITENPIWQYVLAPCTRGELMIILQVKLTLDTLGEAEEVTNNVLKWLPFLYIKRGEH